MTGKELIALVQAQGERINQLESALLGLKVEYDKLAKQQAAIRKDYWGMRKKKWDGAMTSTERLTKEYAQRYRELASHYKQAGATRD